MSNCLILDIDGVMITHKADGEKPAGNNKYGPPFDKACVEVLNNIIQQFNPQIIVSSDWKEVMLYDTKLFGEVFIANGVLKGPDGFTPDLRFKYHLMFDPFQKKIKTREAEIKAFVNRNYDKNIAIVDDLPLFFYPDKFIQCKADKGLAQKKVVKGIAKIFSNY